MSGENHPIDHCVSVDISQMHTLDELDCESDSEKPVGLENALAQRFLSNTLGSPVSKSSLKTITPKISSETDGVRTLQSSTSRVQGGEPAKALNKQTKTAVSQPATKTVFKKPAAKPVKKPATVAKSSTPKTAVKEAVNKDTVFKTPKPVAKKPVSQNQAVTKKPTVKASSETPSKTAVKTSAPLQKVVSKPAGKSPIKVLQQVDAKKVKHNSAQNSKKEKIAAAISSSRPMPPTSDDNQDTFTYPDMKGLAQLPILDEGEEDLGRKFNDPRLNLKVRLPSGDIKKCFEVASISKGTCTFICNACNISLLEGTNFESHLSGKKHTKNAVIVNMSQEKVPETTFVAGDSSEQKAFTYKDMKGLTQLPILDEGEEDLGRKYEDPRLNLKIRLPGGEIKRCFEVSTEDNNTFKYKCNSCNVPIIGEKNFEAHASGRKHNKNAVIINLGKAASKAVNTPVMIPTVDVPDSDDESDEDNYEYQKPADQKSREPIQLMSGSYGTCPPGEEEYQVLEDSETLQSIVDGTKDIAFVGADLMLEIVNSDEDVVPIYHCVVCDKKLNNKNSIENHLAAVSHRLRYLKKYFPWASAAFDACSSSLNKPFYYDALSEVCEAIETKFGRYKAAKIPKNLYTGNEKKVKEAVLASHLIAESADFKFTGLLEELKRRKELNKKELVSSMSVLGCFGAPVITEPKATVSKAPEPPTKRKMSDSTDQATKKNKQEEKTIENVETSIEKVETPPVVRDDPKESVKETGDSTKRFKSYYESAKLRVDNTEDISSEEEVVEIAGEAISSDEEGLIEEDAESKLEKSRVKHPLQLPETEKRVTSARMIEESPRYEVSPYPPSGYFPRMRFPRPRGFGMQRGGRGRSMIMAHMNFLRQTLPGLLPGMEAFMKSQMEEEGKLVSRAVRDAPSKRARSPSRSPRRRSRRSYSRSRSRSRRSHSRSRRSRSRSRDTRSESPFQEYFQSFKRYRKEMRHQRDKHDSRWRLFSRRPEEHPAYKAEWTLFWEKRYREILISGKDPNKHDFKSDWVDYWKDKSKTLEKEEKDATRRKLLKQYRFDRSPSTPSRRLFYERRKRSRRHRSTSSEKRQKNHKIDEMMGYVRRSSKSPSKTSKKFSESVIDTLRLLSAMEDQLASYGPKINPLLTKALKMEEFMKHSSESLLVEREVQELFIVVKEKLSGQLQASLVSSSKVDATETAVRRISALLKKVPQGNASKENVNFEGINVSEIAHLTLGMNETVVAQEIAKTLLSQGKEDITEKRLHELMHKVLEKQKELKKQQPSTSQMSVPPPGLVSMQVRPVGPPTSSFRPPSSLGMLQSSYTSEKAMKPSEHAAFVKNLVATNNFQALSVDDMEFCMKNIRIFNSIQQNSLLMHMQRLEQTGDPKSTQVKELLLASDGKVSKGGSTSTAGPMGERKTMADSSILSDAALHARQKSVAKKVRDKLQAQQIFSQFMVKTASDRPGFGYHN